jgi:uncharacterized protein (DUF885 family)
MTLVRSLPTRLFLLLFPAFACADPAAVERLHALFDAAWERNLRENPTMASSAGDRRYNTQWADLSDAARQERHRLDRQVLADLARIPRESLPPAEQLNYDLFEREYGGRIAAHPFRSYLYALTPRGGVQTLNETSETLPFQTTQDYEDWLARLRGLGAYIDQYITMLQTAISERRTHPRVIMERVLPQLAMQIVEQPQHSPFYQPFERFPDDFPAAARQRLQAEAARLIAAEVVPAYRRFERFYREQYLPACRDTVGIRDTPQGEAYYQNRIEHFTTTRMTAGEIHRLGLEEVARIRGEMDAIIERTGFEGSFEAFLEFLRTDPRFYFETGEELLRAYTVTAKKIDPELVKLFGRLPRMPYGVRPIPDTSAPNTYTAYYMAPALDGSRAGYFYVNLYRPEVRPRYEIEALSIHEAVPGHHLQIALAQELGEMPKFRRTAGYTAYVEGWALYAESLGEDLGLYTDPYSKFGQLTYEIWRAIRLVVDTGLHAKGWTRQQAIDYMTANSGKTGADIVNEIDRYISWPGQALAYKIGELRIKALRAEAEQALGERFDIRAFHDTVLSTGAVPLDVLERTVREWLDNQVSG